MRVLVCGGRDFTNTSLVYDVLDDLMRCEQVDCIIEGDARGVDRIAGYWAKKNRVDLILFPADWTTHGKAAGPIRNQKMIDDGKPDWVIAFPGGRGTADMMSRAERANIPITRIGF